MRIRAAFMLLSVLSLVAAPLVRAQEPPQLQFELEDQFKNLHRSSDYLGRVVMLIGSDRDGVPFNGEWGRQILEPLSDHPRYDQLANLAHADMRGVPFFLKKMIRGKFPQEPEKWVILDWKGKIPKAYGFTKKASNVLVFSPDGSLVHHAAGQEPDEAAVQEVIAAIRTMLDSEPGDSTDQTAVED